jgi:ABC-type multidrug transport system ATPase subunit
LRINHVHVGHHRALTDVSVDFKYTQSDFVLKNLYGQMGLTLVAGSNGSGKTSLLSFIATVFHNLERFPERIPGRFSIGYVLESNEQEEICCVLYRAKVDGDVWLRVEGEFDKPIGRKKKRQNDDDLAFLTYRDATPYLPRNVIVSGFSLQGEYPGRRPSNFIGDQRVLMYDISNLYGYNHFQFPPLSSAISRLFSMGREQAGPMERLEQLLNVRFTGQVFTRERAFGGEGDWEEFNSDVAKAESEGEIYINDIEMVKEDGSLLTFSLMSSGQKMLVARFLSILQEIQNGSLVIIEEPELHLDPAWSRQIISLLISFFKSYNAHFMIATHSFALLNAVPTECIVVAKAGSFRTLGQNTLLANESALSEALFDPLPNYIEQSIRELATREDSEKLVELLSILGESSLRYDIFAKIFRKTKDDAESQ